MAEQAQQGMVAATSDPKTHPGPRVASVETSGRSLKMSSADSFMGWTVQPQEVVPPIAKRLRPNVPWSETEGWSGATSDAWAFLISDTDSRTALTWGRTAADAARHATPLVIPAILRREGILDAHGAVVAPDAARPDDGLFISGLSGAGKSTMLALAVLAGARFLSDDSNAIGLVDGRLKARARRPARVALAPPVANALLPRVQGTPFRDKVVLALDREFPQLLADVLHIRGVVFLESPGNEATPVRRLAPAESYRRLILGHPMLTLDRGARPCFPTVRALSSLPSWQVGRGSDLLLPGAAHVLLCRLLKESDAG